MARIETNDIGRSLSSEIQFPATFTAEFAVQATPGCELLADKWVFIEMLQEFLNNCAEKQTDGPIQIGVTVKYEESSDMFHMHVEDNVAYEPSYAKGLVKLLNSNKLIHANKRGRGKVTGEGQADEPWLFIPHTRDVMHAWGGDLVFSVARDNTVQTDITWNKTAMLTIRPPQLKGDDIFKY